jgi:large subunit ribosomal protein L22
MGSRKHNRAEHIKEMKKSISYAKLNHCPTSPRKMRRMADLIRGIEVEKALHVLKMAPQESSLRLRKLLLSAIANWQQKNESKRVEDANLIVSTVFVNQGRSLKRLRTAPQGRGHRIQKRSNHVTLIVDSKNPSAEVKNK